MNDLTLNWKKLSKMLPEMSTLEDRGYTKQEIVTMLNWADEREKVLILLLASTGMRIGAVPALKVKHLKPMHVNNELVACMITVYVGSKDQYFTFCTSECYKMIQDYLDYRKRNHERITEESYIIRDKVNTNVPTRGDKLQRSKQLSWYTVQNMLQRLLYRSALRKRAVGKQKQRHETKLAHAFRKFWNTTCKDSGIDPLHKELLLGHRTGLEDNYYRPQEDVLLHSYIKVANNLTINEAQLLREELKELQAKSTTEINLLNRIEGLEKP